MVAAPVVRAEQQAHKLWRQAVPEGRERFSELVAIDVAGAVSVESVEEATPCGEEAPESAWEMVSVCWFKCRYVCRKCLSLRGARGRTRTHQS